MKKYLNEDLLKIVISIILLIVSFFFKDTTKIIILLVSYIIISYEMYIESFENIKEKEFFDENILMIIATIGAFFIKNYIEGVLVIILYQIGEYFSHLAVHKSKESITKLMDLRVDKVLVEKNNKQVEVKIENVKENDIFIVKPGEKIALDGIIIEGESFLDTSSLTGESVPRKVSINDNVLSGTINKNSIIKVKATTTLKTTTSQKIIDLIENSNNRKSETETFIRKFAKVYTPVVVCIAVLLVIVPTILGGNFNEWLYRALVFLVTSCPCALVISVPLGYFCGIGKSAREGILIKGSKELENLSSIDYLVLDKTGTITEGVFEVSEIETNMEKEEFIQIAASAEQNSIHPISQAIQKENKLELKKVTNYEELSGKGIICKIDNKKVYIGNKKLLQSYNIEFEEQDKTGTIVYVAIDNKYEGYILISDKIKKSSYCLKELKKEFNKEIVILSGDNEKVTSNVAKKVGVSKYHGNLLPIDKVEQVKKYMEDGRTMFIGDGINDAPVIKMADIGVSMGQIGSDAAIEASDIVLMTDNLEKIKTAITISQITLTKVKQSIIFALAVKFIVLFLAAIGKTSIILAVFADVGVTFLAILNVLQINIKKLK